MELVRVASPHPKWTLEYISLTLYGEGDRKDMMRGTAQWVREKEELVELCALEQLGWYEWKAEAQRLLDQWGGSDVTIVNPQGDDTVLAARSTKQSSSSSPSWIQRLEKQFS
jgi:hypothetical protein